MLQAADVDSSGFSTAHSVWVVLWHRVRMDESCVSCSCRPPDHSSRESSTFGTQRKQSPFLVPVAVAHPPPPGYAPLPYCVLCREERVRETVDGERARKIGTSLTFASTLPPTTSFVLCLELFPPSASPSQIAAVSESSIPLPHFSVHTRFLVWQFVHLLSFGFRPISLFTYYYHD